MLLKRLEDGFIFINLLGTGWPESVLTKRQSVSVSRKMWPPLVRISSTNYELVMSN